MKAQAGDNRTGSVKVVTRAQDEAARLRIPPRTRAALLRAAYDFAYGDVVNLMRRLNISDVDGPTMVAWLDAGAAYSKGRSHLHTHCEVTGMRPAEFIMGEPIAQWWLRTLQINGRSS